jgi:hypothetical protein
MSERVPYGIPAEAGFTFADLGSVIAAVEPDANHDALRRALTARWPAVAWRVAAPEDDFTMNGGIVDHALARVADNAASWLRQRIAEAAGDYLAVWRRYKVDPSLLRTEFRGSTVWVFAPLGPDTADYVQLAVDLVQEVVLGPLVDSADWRRPYDADELCAGTGTASADPRPIGAPHYRLNRAVHAGRFLAELASVEHARRGAFVAGNVLHAQLPRPGRPGTIAVSSTHRVPRGTALQPGYRAIEITEEDPDYLTRAMPLERFYADWTASSAGRLGNQLVDHWAMRFSDYDDGRGRQLHGVPIWLARQNLPRIEIQPGETVFALMDRLQRFDEELGCAMAWYFFMLHGNRLSSAVGELVADAVDDGVITLPSWDRDVLRQWKAAPYSF